MDNVIPIRPGVQPVPTRFGVVPPAIVPAGAIRPAGQSIGDVSPWSIIGWILVGIVVYEGGKYVLAKAANKATPRRSARY